MHQAVEVEVVGLLRQVVEEQHRAPLPGEEVLQRQHLAAVAQRPLRQQPDLRKAVEDDAGRRHARDLVHHHLDGLAELQVGGVDDRLLAFGIEAELGRDQLVDLDAVEIPAMRARHMQQFLPALRERDVEAALVLGPAFEHELERQRRLARAGLALDQVHAVAGIAAAENVIERPGPGRHRAGLGFEFRIVHGSLLATGRVVTAGAAGLKPRAEAATPRSPRPARTGRNSAAGAKTRRAKDAGACELENPAWPRKLEPDFQQRQEPRRWPV